MPQGFPQLGVDPLLIESPILNDTRKSGTALRINRCPRQFLMDQAVIAPRICGKHRRKDTYLPKSQFDHIGAPSLNNAENPEFIIRLVLVNQSGDRVAGYCNHLYMLILQKVQTLMCQTQDILLASVPVRLVFPIPQKNNIFLRQESLKLLYDGISSQACIHHADWSLCIRHSIAPSLFAYVSAAVRHCF